VGSGADRNLIGAKKGMDWGGGEAGTDGVVATGRFFRLSIFLLIDPPMKNS
jgi:hypothetical protein